MTGKPSLVAAMGLALALLTGCFEPNKREILAKAENVSTKQELRDALGEPDDVSKLGPIETWSYKASNGEVSFVITGSTVALKTTGSAKSE